jgi:hypothetical protein
MIIRKWIHTVPRWIYQNSLNVLSVLIKLFTLNFVFTLERDHSVKIFRNLITLWKHILLPRHYKIKNTNSIRNISFIVHFFWSSLLLLDERDFFLLLFLCSFTFTFLGFRMRIIFLTAVGRLIFEATVTEVIINFLNRFSFSQTNRFS